MNRKRMATVIGLATLVVGAGTVAALWSANGSGSGQARATTAQALTVNAATGATDLYPGFTAGDVYFTLTNPNPYPVTFTSMTAGAITSSNPSGCPSSNITVANATGLSLAVGANASSGTQSVGDVVTMAAAAPDACQGATFTISLTMSGAQS